MKYQELIESCRRAIESGKCLGCQALEDYNFKGNSNCKYSKENLGKQERIKL